MITQDEIRELEAINAEMQDAVPANEVRRYLIANHRFHFKIYGAAGSLRRCSRSSSRCGCRSARS